MKFELIKREHLVLCSRGKKCYSNIYIYIYVCYFSGLFTTVYIYVNVICGKLLHTLAITTLYFSGTVADCPLACKCRKNMIKQAVHGCHVGSKHWLLDHGKPYCQIIAV